MSVSLPLVTDHFGGGANLTPQDDSDLADIINQLAFEYVHEPVVAPGKTDGPPGQNPQFAVKGVLAYLEFTVNTDAAHRTFKIPYGYVGEGAFHIHWTKSQDTNQSGNTVRWRITYVVYDGHDEDAANGTAQIKTVDDTYLDAGTTSRFVYRTIDVALDGFITGNYVAVQIEAITPSGAVLAEPGLISVDFTYKIQRGLVSQVHAHV